MRRITSLLGVATLSLLSLAGCAYNTEKENENSANRKIINIIVPEKKPQEVQEDFAKIYGNNVQMVSGYFDKNNSNGAGLDLIVAVQRNDLRDGSSVYLYYYENDGKGNFKLRTYSK